MNSRGMVVPAMRSRTLYGGVECFQFAKNRAERVRWRLPFAFFARSCDQCAKPRPVQTRKFGGQRIERLRLRKQAVAPSFERVLARGVHVVTVRPGREPVPDRTGIDVTHQLADELELPFAATPCGDPSGRNHGLDEPLREVHFRGQFGEALCIERNQRQTEILQRMHVRLAARLGRRQFRIVVGCARQRRDVRVRAAALQFVGPGHRFGGSSGGSERPPGETGIRFAMIADALRRGPNRARLRGRVRR